MVRRLAWFSIFCLFLLIVGANMNWGATPANGPLAPLKQAAGDVHYTKLIIANEHLEKGIYDPSVAYAPDGKTGWLAYSWVGGNGNIVSGKVSLGEYISTHLARTNDGGATWTFVQEINHSTDGTFAIPGGKELKGVWRYEVPSLASDPTDPDPSRRWKLFVHHYFWERDGQAKQTHSWIGLFTAADPAGKWSDEEPLLAAGKNARVPDKKAPLDVNLLDSSLGKTVAYTEPGALARDGHLFLSLSALSPHIGLAGISVRYHIILLDSADHGATWKSLGALLTPEDAEYFGYDYFDGSSLAVDGGKMFLLAVPGCRADPMHDGCVAFEVESMSPARLKRDSAGHPIISKYFPPQPSIRSGPGAGQACFDPGNIKGGLLMPQFNLSAYPEIFQIYQTAQRLAE